MSTIYVLINDHGTLRLFSQTIMRIVSTVKSVNERVRGRGSTGLIITISVNK